jgi:PST family polysaccharide transporter
MTDRANAGRSIAWSAVENAGLVLISFGSLILYSRMLSPSTFGLFSIVLAVIELLDVVARMLFHDALVQRKDVTERHFDTAFTVTVVLSVLMMAGCCAAAPLFGTLVHDPEAAQVLAWMSLCLPCASVTATVVARQRREFFFKALAVRSLVGRLVGMAIGLVLVFLGAGIWALVAQQVLIALSGSVVLWVTANSRPRLRFGLRELQDLLTFGLLSVGTLLLTFATKRVFTILAGIGLGTQAAGVLNLAFRTVDAFYGVTATAVWQVALPMLSGLQSDRERLFRAYTTATTFTCLALYSCFLGLGALAPEVVELMFGAKWLEASPYVTIVSFLIIVQAPRILIGPLLTALGRPADSLVTRAVELTVMLLGIWLSGVPTLPWAIAIWVLRELVGFPVTTWVMHRATGLGLAQQLRGVTKPLLASSIMTASLWLLRQALPAQLPALARLCVLVPTGAAVFVASMCVIDMPLVRELAGFARLTIMKRRAS